MGWFERWIEKGFRKAVRGLLIRSNADFDKMEGLLPVSTVESANADAFMLYGKDNHNKPPAIYQAKCAEAAEFIAERHAAAITLLY